MPLIKLEQFAPDADNSQLGVAVDMNHLLPTFRGYKAAPTPVDVGADVLISACLGAAAVRKLDNSTRVFAGTATKLYELDGTTLAWNDVSRVAAYNASVDTLWDFAQYGNVTIASNKGDTLQFIEGGTDFADIAGAPKAKLCETVSNFIMIADTNDIGFGDSPDRWWCCAIGDYTDWTPDTATQCVSGRLTSSPGRINALRRLGDSIVAYKDRAIFTGSYVGAPEVWAFQEIPGQVGCLSQNGVVDIGSAHVFVGYDNFWIFDGSRPIDIGNPIKNWFYSRLYTDYAYRIQAVHDRKNSNVYFYYPSVNGGGSLDSCLIYDYRVNKWGVDNHNVEAAIDFIVAGESWAGAFAGTETWDSVGTSLIWDSQFLVAGQPVPSYVGTDHKVYSMTGQSSDWDLTTNDFGDDSQVSLLKRVTPRFLQAPTTCTMQNFYRQVMGESLTTDQTVNYSNGRFDVLRAARWHRLVFSATGGGEITGLDVQAVPVGYE